MASTSPVSLSPAQAPVLLYDGECGLCNAGVRLLLRIDRSERLLFAPLQGASAQAYLRHHRLPTKDFDSMIFVPDWARRDELPPRFRTDAVLSAVAEIGGGWSLLRALRVIPPPLRDAVYRLVAQFRYRVFGPYRPTPLPHPEWAARFLP